MTIKTIGKDRGSILIWLALFVFSLLMPCAALAADTLKVEVQPQNASRWRGTSSGTAIIAVVTGGTGGAVWGGGAATPYTDDSSISTAAVHAGALKSGETGLVAITILPGRSNYTFSTANGVTTKSYGSYDGSYSIESYTYDSTTALADPGNFDSWGELTGTFNVSLTGVNSGSIWGTDIYTSDSLLAMAAVHAGKLNVGVTDVVPVTLSAGLSSYVGSTRNGVTSNSYGSYGASFTFGSGCTATINTSLLLHIPACDYHDPIVGQTSFWMDLVYVFHPTSPLFKLTNYGTNDPTPSCSSPASLNDALEITLTGVQLPNRDKILLTLQYDSASSVDGNIYFEARTP